MTIQRSKELIDGDRVPRDILINNPAMLHACKRADLASVFALYEGGFRVISKLQRKDVLKKFQYQQTWDLPDITGTCVLSLPTISVFNLVYGSILTFIKY